MKRAFIIGFILMSFVGNVTGQNDDIYFFGNKKKTEVKVKAVTPGEVKAVAVSPAGNEDEPDVYSDDVQVPLDIDDDTYNRRGTKSYMDEDGNYVQETQTNGLTLRIRTNKGDTLYYDVDTLYVEQTDDGWVNGFDGDADDYEYAMRIVRFRNPRYAIPISSPLYWDVVYGGGLWPMWDWNIYDDGLYAYVFPSAHNIHYYWDWRYGSWGWHHGWGWSPWYYGYGWGWDPWYYSYGWGWDPWYYGGWNGWYGYGYGWYGHHGFHHGWNHFAGGPRIDSRRNNRSPLMAGSRAAGRSSSDLATRGGGGIGGRSVGTASRSASASRNGDTRTGAGRTVSPRSSATGTRSQATTQRNAATTQRNATTTRNQVGGQTSNSRSRSSITTDRTSRSASGSRSDYTRQSTSRSNSTSSGSYNRPSSTRSSVSNSSRSSSSSRIGSISSSSSRSNSSSGSSSSTRSYSGGSSYSSGSSSRSYSGGSSYSSSSSHSSGSFGGGGGSSHSSGGGGGGSRGGGGGGGGRR